VTVKPANDQGQRPGWVAWICALLVGGGVVLMIFAGALPPASGLVALGALLAIVFWQIRTHLPGLLLVFVTVLLAGVVFTRPLPKVRPDQSATRAAEQLSRAWAAAGPFKHDLPIVVHLVLDELMSPGAMTEDLPNGSVTRQSLLDFGATHSFRTFDSVYSRHFLTSDSLLSLMNQEYLGRTEVNAFMAAPFDSSAKLYRARDNSYFADMAGRGYRTAVFQARYIDFCANKNVDLCETFDSFDPGGADLTDVDATQRVRLWQTVLRAYGQSYTSELGERLLNHLYGLETREVGVIGHDGGRYDVQRFLEWFDRFTTFAASVPRGTHVFAHFLVPHAPYLLLQSCVVSGKVDNGYFLSQYPQPERAERRLDSYRRYLAQVGCVERKLNDFMMTIRRVENYRDAVIVIHGDHGSRISISNLLEEQTARDMVDNHATFFAVRSPGVSAGVDCQFVSLTEVFRRYLGRHDETKTPSGAPLPLIMQAAGGARVEAPMPSFGCAGDPTDATR
jgi:hypothetical protein